MFWFEPVLVWFGSVLVWFVSFRFVFFGPRGVLVLLGASEVLVIVKLLVAILGGASLPFPSLPLKSIVQLSLSSDVSRGAELLWRLRMGWRLSLCVGGILMMCDAVSPAWPRPCRG